MHKLLTAAVFTLTLLVGVTSIAPIAHAATQEEIDTCRSQHPNWTVERCTELIANNSPEALAAQNTVNDVNVPDKPLDTKLDDAEAGFGFVMAKIMSLFAWLVGVAAITLDNAVYYTVVTMGGYVHNLTAIGVAWTVLRDLGNIMLIFGFLAIGISVILNVDWYGGGKKMLPMLIVAAVFLNFSLFFAEAVIDVGNLFATQFYTQINGGNPAQPLKYRPGIIHDEGISNKLMNQLGLQTMYDVRGEVNKKIFEAGNTWVIGFMGILLFIVTAFVLFSLAFILIARFVILIFLLVLAPIGFAGLAVPQMKRRADQWWSMLFEQTVTAPILLLMLYVALRVITDVHFLTGFCIPGETGTLGGANTNTACTANALGWVSGDFGGFASFILSFIVAMGLLIAVIIQSKNLSAFGAGKATALAGKLSFGATAWAGRGVVGTGLGRGLLGNRFIKRGAVSDNALVKYSSRALGFVGNRLQNRTYDVRNTGALGAVGVDAGTASKLTARDAQGKQYGAKPVKEWLEHADEEWKKLGKEQAFKDAQSDLTKGKINKDQYDRIVAPVVSKMSTKELEELDGIKHGVEALVNNLSPQQFEALMKSDKLSDHQKGNIKKAKYSALDTARTSGTPSDVKKALDALSKGELESMPTEMLTDNAVLSQLTDKQRDTIADSKERTVAEKDAVRNSSPGGQVKKAFATPGLGATAAALKLDNLTPTQVAKLPKDVLTSRPVAWKLTPAMLDAIKKEDKLSASEIATIRANVLNGGLRSAIDYITTSQAASWWS